MIREVDISNLKSFAGDHAIELAPITLVYGPNSAGKSSLLHSLALMKQTLEPLANRVDLERPPLGLRGDLVDLGSFSSVINRHDSDLLLRVGVRFSDRRESRRTVPSARVRSGRTAYAAFTFGYDAKQKAPVQRDAALGVDKNVCWFVPLAPSEKAGQEELFPVPEGRRELAFKLRDQESVDAYLHLLEERLTARTRARDENLVDPERELLREVIWSRFAESDPVLFHARGFFPSFPSTRDVMRGFRELLEQPGHGRERVLHTATAPILLGDSLRAPVQALEALLANMAYLGPLRAAPTRFQQLSNELPTTVGASGEHTPMLLARDPELVEAVNEWMSRLDMSYELAVDSVTSEAIGLELGDLLVTTLRDRRSRIAVTPQDVGFGVSQLLPVIVQLLHGSRRSVVIEQPEIHIHPRLQAEVGDLVLAAAGQPRGNQVIVETHSEHLMLRIQRRLRESDGWPSPADIAVIYVDTGPDGAGHAMRLHLDEHGNFVDEWPHGFFAERTAELFAPRRPTPPKRLKKT